MPMIDTDTEEGKAELQKLIDNETKGLKDKNAELLGDLKKQKDAVKSVQDQIDELKSAKEQAEHDAAEKSGDVEKIKTSMEAKFAKERDALAAERDASKATVHNLLVDNGLTDALTKSGITNPVHLKAAKAMILAEHKPEVGEADGKAVATIGGQSITEFVSAFAQGEDGKHFVTAAVNSGGGASGSNNTSKAAVKGDMGGDRGERTVAIAARFPDLK